MNPANENQGREANHSIHAIHLHFSADSWPAIAPLPRQIRAAPNRNPLMWHLRLRHARRHIVIVVGENTNGSDAERGCPWLDALGAKYAMATRYYANTHPSSELFRHNDRSGGHERQWPDATHVAGFGRQRGSELLAARKTWKAYAEDVPSSLRRGDAANSRRGTFLYPT